MKIISTERLPIKSWCNEIDDQALQQVKNVANLPFAFHHIALMADAHGGYGMPIGGVACLDGVISPNMVGVDIGCGMAAVKTSLTSITSEKLKKIFGGGKKNPGGIRSSIPLGFDHHKTPQMIADSEKEESDLKAFLKENCPISYSEFESAKHQVGTLGGGNHFIEIQKGNDGHIWFMVHSGSRNIGYKVANYYNKEARKLDAEWNGGKVPQKWDLAFLYLDSELGQTYKKEMDFCLYFARQNRKLMSNIIKDIMQKATKCDFLEEVNIHHNYAAAETHFGKEVIIHRKGATSAQKGELGIIPGSQGTCSYIVKGKGNPESFMSCSHGAGRKISRKKARAVLDLEKEKKHLDDKGILHSIRGRRDLDEAPSAYKNIDKVMEEQKDLIDIVIKLEPLAVVKG